MFLKTSFMILLSLAAPKNVVGGASADTAECLLQASMQCLANNGTFASCCLNKGFDPNNGMCTLLLCLDELSIRNECLCNNIKEACDQLAVFTMTGFWPCRACATWSVNAASTMAPPPPISIGTFA